MVDFKFADIGEGIHEGTILKWEVQVGGTIEDGDTIVVIETDKVNAEIPSPVSGVILKLGPEEGQVVHVGETLAVIDDGSEKPVNNQEENDALKPIAEGDEENAAGVVGSIEVSNNVIAASDEEEQVKEPTTKRVLATPVARRLAKDLGVDITKVDGSGQSGRVMKDDIQKAAETGTAPIQKATLNPFKEVVIPTFNHERTRREKISKLRKTIAQNMTISKSVIPHTTIMDEIIVDELVAFRNEQKARVKEEGYSLTYMPFIIKALTSTLEQYPIFNSSFDHTTDEIIYKNYMNIGVAVDTPDGLIVPNIKDANTKSILQLATELADLKIRANDKKITLNDIKDGTISITNYGVFDSTFGAPVIKYPEVAILGIGRIVKKPVVRDDKIVISYVLPLSLSIDHRVIDGGDAGRFMRTFKTNIQQPITLLLR